MALETGNYVADLVVTNPDGADQRTTSDDHHRLQKKVLKNTLCGFVGGVAVTGTDGGSVNTYTVTPTSALPSYTSRLSVIFSPTVTNTSTATINVSGLGAKDIKRIDGSALVAGDLASGSIYAAIYNGTEFRLMAPTKNYIDQISLGTAYPASPTDAGKFLQYTGSAYAWAASGDVTRRVITGADTVVIGDKNKLIDITSGTFTLGFSAAATLGDGFNCFVRNSGTGDVTLDPNGAETIDGLASFVMYPNEVRLVQCDGAALYSVVLSPFSKAFTASGTLTRPPGYSNFGGIGWGAGASGGKTSDATNYGGGGGGGAGVPFTLSAAALGASIAVSIGAGGAAVSTVVVGNAGGNTTLGSLLTFYGGGGGGQIAGGSGSAGGGGGGLAAVGSAGGSGTSTAGAGGASNASTSATDYVFGGAAGSAGAGTTPATAYYGGGGGGGKGGSPIAGGNSVYGGGGGGGGTSGGSSKLGGSGGAGGTNTNGTDGTAPGGGGGGTGTGALSGAGARGELRIWGIC